MLTGTKAFTGDSPIHVAYQHVHGSIPAPSSRVESVPSELDTLVALATARDPDQRPADAGEFLSEVRKARAALSPTELDHRPEGAAAEDGGMSTVAVARTTALPIGERPSAPSQRAQRAARPRVPAAAGAPGSGLWRRCSCWPRRRPGPGTSPWARAPRPWSL